MEWLQERWLDIYFWFFPHRLAAHLLDFYDRQCVEAEAREADLQAVLKRHQALYAEQLQFAADITAKQQELREQVAELNWLEKLYQETHEQLEPLLQRVATWLEHKDDMAAADAREAAELAEDIATTEALLQRMDANADRATTLLAQADTAIAAAKAARGAAAAAPKRGRRPSRSALKSALEAEK